MNVIAAYAAGLFEGEGCSQIQVKRQQVLLLCSIAMIDREPIAMLHKHWGGSLKSRPRQAMRNARDQWVWSVVSRDALRFLETIRPYTQSARRLERIDLAIEFQRQKTYDQKVNRSAEYRERQVAYAHQMRQLNRRGRLGVTAEYLAGSWNCSALTT